jgi:2-oxoglutarate dehydrogenase E1 component
LLVLWFFFGLLWGVPCAATASGYSKVHAQEQAEIVETAFSI